MPIDSGSWENMGPALEKSVMAVGEIKTVADKYPYYKYNGMWSRYMENFSFALVFAGWLGILGDPEGTLLSYQRVANYMKGTI
jgi:hypothetical protein